MKARLIVVVMSVLLAVASVGICDDAVVQGPSSSPDPRVGKLLKEAGLHYMVDETGDYMLQCEAVFSSNQAVHVWINSHTSKYSTLEMREIWSAAYRVSGRISPEDAENLLMRNGIIKIGSWQIEQYKDHYTVIFSIKCDATSQTAESLKEMIEFVALTSDGVAKQIANGKLLPPGL